MNRQRACDIIPRAVETPGSGIPSETAPGPGGPRAHAAALGVLLLTVYLSDGGFVATSDALPNAYLGISLLREGNLSFTPEEMPFMFRWSVREGERWKPVGIRRWDQRIEGVPAEELRREGGLRLEEPRYYLAPSSREGEYVGIYGPGPGLAAAPVVAAGMLVLGDPRGDLWAVGWLGKAAACLLVAGSAVLLFLAVAGRASLRAAWLLAGAYGLGTCVWSQSSQALWQQTPVLFFLSLGAWALLREPSTLLRRGLCGFGVGAAVLCRPTWGILLVALTLWLLKTDRRGLAAYALGAAAPLLALAAYAAVYLESIFDFGQMDAAADVALTKTGSMDVWQTPPWEGAAGILLSPARGLFVYSPFLAFAGWGVWASWRERNFSSLRIVGLAVAGLLLLSFRWFDWWGGHSFGYRLIVDASPLLALLILPVADRILSRPPARWTFAGLALWSLALQFLGAFAYDQDGWNARARGYEVRVPGELKPRVAASPAEAEALASRTRGEVTGRHRMDVDRAEYRHRLWSLRDNPIAYYALHFSESRAARSARLRALRGDR